MSVAIDLFGAVYTTAGGTRYHADPACYALANGRAYHAWCAGRTDDVERGTGLYELERRSTISAVQHSYTACLRCVPTEQATQPLPLVTFSYGHEPVTETGYYGPELVCARCDRIGAAPYLSALWPCTSAVVLGLVPRDGAL